MKITQIRNATILVEIGEHRILLDPMLSPPSSLPGFRMFRGKRRKNPLIPLPEDAESLFESATVVMITHEHPDHLDQLAINWIVQKNLEVWASSIDAPNLLRKGLNAVDIASYDLRELSIEIIPATHGHGIVGWLMGPVAGYYLNCPGEPTLYITGDSVLTKRVQEAVRRLQPHVIVAPAGTANFGIGKDILFSEEELVDLATMAPGKVLFNHLESIDHCLMTRARLRELMLAAGVGDKVLIPADGETNDFSTPANVSNVNAGKSANKTPGFQKWLTAKFAGT